MDLQNIIEKSFDTENNLLARSIVKKQPLFLVYHDKPSVEDKNIVDEAIIKLRQLTPFPSVKWVSFDQLINDSIGVDSKELFDMSKKDNDNLKCIFNLLKTDDHTSGFIEGNYMFSDAGIDIFDLEKSDDDFKKSIFQRSIISLLKENMEKHTDSKATSEFTSFDLAFLRKYTSESALANEVVSNIAEIEHAVYKKLDLDFMKNLSINYTRFNLQSTVPGSFLLVTEYSDSFKGKFNTLSADKLLKLNNKQLNEFPAIFIDNGWRANSIDNQGLLGTGLGVLDWLKDKYGGPVFYQTAHNQENFTEKEIKRIKDRNGILIPKNVAPKINMSKLAAFKEIALSNGISEEKIIYDYLVKGVKVNDDYNPIKVNVQGKEYYISFTEAVHKPSEDIVKTATFNQRNIEDTLFNHRMYVLAAFHDNTKNAMNHDLFSKPTVEDFSDYESLELNLARNGFDIDYSTDYQSLVDKHKKMKPTVLSHNDAKWDNWFSGVLGDLGHASIGTEYKDIARALLPDGDNQKTMALEGFDKIIDSYLAFRGIFDRDHKVNSQEFKDNVYESIFIESLRLASFESDKNKAHAQILLDTAENIKNKISVAKVQDHYGVRADQVEMSYDVA